MMERCVQHGGILNFSWMVQYPPKGRPWQETSGFSTKPVHTAGLFCSLPCTSMWPYDWAVISRMWAEVMWATSKDVSPKPSFYTSSSMPRYSWKPVAAGSKTLDNLGPWIDIWTDFFPPLLSTLKPSNFMWATNKLLLCLGHYWFFWPIYLQLAN